MSAYYNEYDPFAAAWLRELITEGLIAPGEVDERSINDVAPEDLRGFVQCHFFAGIGVWSLALRLAGWEDNRAIWSGSCPCQPFSGAGKGAGFDDERHLWPAFEWLIANGKPHAVPVVGEQVASADGLDWLDLVSADMEGQGYAFGALDTCAAGFGSPHIRQRLYWLADGLGDACSEGPPQFRWGRVEPARHTATSEPMRLADAMPTGRAERGTQSRRRSLAGSGVDGRLADAASGQSRNRNVQSGREHGQLAQDVCDSDDNRVSLHPLAYWANADWLLCRDPDGARFRPVEPGSFPLVDARSLLNRLAEVRGAGNAINLAQAQGFIEAVMECRP